MRGGATANGLGGVWMAWVPDGLQACTAERFVAAGLVGPWYSTASNGPEELANRAGLMLGTILKPIQLGPDGVTRIDAFVWTGTLATGQASRSGGSCGGWLLTTGNATVGRSTSATATWTNQLQPSATECSTEDNHIYCFER